MGKRQARMEHLASKLNHACELYYGGAGHEMMTDATYDQLLAELIQLEEEVGARLAHSPTKKVGFQEDGDKIRHYKPVLSLRDTKDVEKLQCFLGEQEGVLSWKLDGVSIVLYYKNGVLDKALSRGDGHWGKDITRNVVLMGRVPIHLPMEGDAIIRGEGCLSLREFDQIKKTAEGERYSNPRNMAAGLINATRTASILLRHMTFVAHTVVVLDPRFDFPTRAQQFAYLAKIGFRTVEYVLTTNDGLKAYIDQFTNDVEHYEFPVDGLVLSINDILYGGSLGATARFPKHSMAFKWPDEHELTTVTGMDWSVSNTGLITPIVIFEPIQLEGTVVRRANLHNLKVFEELAIGVGDTVEVYKANKIIPKVHENLTRSGPVGHPEVCPVCGGATDVVVNKDKKGRVITKKLYCHACGGN